MLYCGELCRGCSGSCVQPPTEATPLELQCWECGGTGCDACKKTSGYRPVTQCPQKELGAKFARKINLVAHAMNGLLPDAGGVNDQDAWFVDLWRKFKSDVNLIERDRQK